MNRYVLLTVAGFCLLSTVAVADLVIDEDQGLVLDVTSWTGTGTNTSYLVLDFEATGGDSYALGFRWDDTATVLDMFDSFTSNLGLLVELTTYDGYGTFVDNFSWGSESGDAMQYWTHSMSNPDGSGDVSWTDAYLGVESQLLSDGMISGWYNGYNEDYSAIPPSLPLATVPAPGVLALAGLFAMGTSRRRRG
ncbi:MAG: PEP-CTERM sorting domain-containing protein [Phycisphaerales bacterium]|nr:PEP-CTERM sorting domain-containing protein [Phycisphaerales bacterium]